MKVKRHGNCVRDVTIAHVKSVDAQQASKQTDVQNARQSWDQPGTLNQSMVAAGLMLEAPPALIP